MEPGKEQGLADLASRQLGLVTKAQLTQLGVARSTVGRRIASGLMVPVGRRVFRLASATVTHESHVLSACLDYQGVASHRTAAWLHGLAPRSACIEITVPKGQSTRLPGFPGTWPLVRVHTSTNLPSADILHIGPISVTSVARTMLGLAALAPKEIDRAALLEVVSTAIDRGLASDPWLWWLLAQRRCRGRNGVIALESVLAERARLGPTESWLERETLRVLGDRSIRLPVTQRVISRSGRFAARVDFLYEPERIILEALGYAFHRTPAQIEADTRRANELQLLGFDVYQFTTRQIVQSPTSVQATVVRALDEAHAARAA